MVKKNILIVEDEPIVAKDIEICLEKLGHNVIGITAEGEKTLSMIESTKPDLILMDITLKGKMDGIDVANQIKDSRIPVIFLTANTDKSTFEKAKLSEPYGYIIKPFKEIELFTAIEIATQKYNQNSQNDKKLLYSFPESSKPIEDVLFVKSNYTLVKVNINDLIFVEALKDYVIFNTKTARYVIHSTMKNMEEKLSSRDFVRVHRSFIVRLSDVQSVTPQSLTLESIAKEIPIGGSYKESLLKKLKRM